MHNVVRFPPRRSAAVWVLREGPAWLVVAGDHGWICGDLDEAAHEAHWLARNRGLPIRVAVR